MDPFGDIEVASEQAKPGFDVEAYRRWWVKDEELLIECLTMMPGSEGCRMYETKRGKFV